MAAEHMLSERRGRISGTGKAMQVDSYDVPIVMYHSINQFPQENPLGHLSLPVNEFIEHLRFFKHSGFELITLSELIQRALTDDLGKKLFAVLTFDDGFLDNYLIAADILKQYHARGTIFVNPGHTPCGPVRTLEECPNAWGNLNFDEMRELEKRGIFDIQSHTMTHEYIFVSDHLVDLYSPEKFYKYYWLVWKLYPEIKKQWHGDVNRFAKLVPAGYPIFKWGRCLESKQFSPLPEFVKLCVSQFALKGLSCVSDLQLINIKGEFETEPDYMQRINYQLKNSKIILESELSKSIEDVCFPGNVYNDEILSYAATIGYKVFFKYTKQEPGDNLAILQTANKILSQNQLIGLKRISLINDFPRIVPAKTAAYWTSKLRIDYLLGHPIYSRINKVFKTAKRFIKSK